jgi:hypothetical protein
MADSTFATFDSLSSLTFQDYLVGYRGIRETQIKYTDFLQNTLQADLSSKKLISVYSTVNSLSDTWEESVYITPLQVASGSWDSAYSTTKSNSSNWTNAYTNLINNSAAYLLSGTEVNLGQIPVLSGSWNSVYSTTNSNSATWNLGGIASYYLKTTNFVLTAGQKYIIDTTSSVVSAQLPANPATGDTISFLDYGNTWPSKNFVIERNGKAIETLNENLSCNTSAAFSMTYVGGSYGWRVY